LLSAGVFDDLLSEYISLPGYIFQWVSAVCPIVRCTMGQMRQRARKTLGVFWRQLDLFGRPKTIY